MGTGGMGTGGMGTGGMGQGLGQGGIGLQGMGGQQGGNFIGSNANQNQFLGRNVQGQQGGMGMNAMNQFGGNRGGGRNNANNINTMNSMFGGANNANSHPVIRPRQKVAFDYPVPKGDALQTKLQNHLVKVSLRNPTLSNVMLTTNGGGEIVMRGAVSTEAQARLAENLLRLEPGVRTIRNELTFPPAKTDAE